MLIGSQLREGVYLGMLHSLTELEVSEIEIMRDFFKEINNELWAFKVAQGGEVVTDKRELGGRSGNVRREISKDIAGATKTNSLENKVKSAVGEILERKVKKSGRDDKLEEQLEELHAILSSTDYVWWEKLVECVNEFILPRLDRYVGGDKVVSDLSEEEHKLAEVWDY